MPEALDIVNRVVQRVNFQFAAIARAGIDLADRERAPKPAARAVAERLRHLCEHGFVGLWRSDCCGAFEKGVEKEDVHGRPYKSWPE